MYRYEDFSCDKRSSLYWWYDEDTGLNLVKHCVHSFLKFCDSNFHLALKYWMACSCTLEKIPELKKGKVSMSATCIFELVAWLINFEN